MTKSSRRIPCARDLFDIPDDVAYFNTASLSPTLRSGLAAGHASLRTRAQPWTVGADSWSTPAEHRRGLFARIIGASADDVALISATSYGLAAAAANLTARPGQRVLVLAEEYPSGIYTWWRFTERTGSSMLTVRREPGQTWTEAVLAALDETVAVVSVPQVHWTNGALLDLDAIAEAARSAGAALVIDASQSAGAMPLDVGSIRPDFLVSVGYKWLLGPFGLGYLYVAPAHQDGRPLEENWINREGSEDFARLIEYRADYQPGARRYDMGQRTAFELTPLANAALEQITAWGVDNIATTLGGITARLTTAVQQLGLTTPDPHGPHMFGVTVPSGAQSSYLAALADVHVGARGSGLRISPYLYTTDDDIDRLLSALEQAGRR